MKYFSDPTIAGEEAEILRQIQPAEAGAPFRFSRLIGWMGPHCLLLEPVGVQFGSTWSDLTACLEKPKFENKRIRPTKWMLCVVIDALKELHRQRIIHRDVKLDSNSVSLLTRFVWYSLFGAAYQSSLLELNRQIIF